MTVLYCLTLGSRHGKSGVIDLCFAGERETFQTKINTIRLENRRRIRYINKLYVQK